MFLKKISNYIVTSPPFALIILFLVLIALFFFDEDMFLEDPHL